MHSTTRVPYALLTGLHEVALAAILHQHGHHRANVRAGDRVQFAFRGTMLEGVVARLNPQRAHVVVEDGREYRVSYALLQQVERDTEPTTTRSATEMEEIARQARELLAQHQLSQWSFQFDNGRKRAGCCQYGTQVLSLSYEFAKQATEAEIHDTILHEACA